MTSIEPSVAAILRGAGHRVTPQRLLVLSALREAEGHVTAGQVAEIVRRTYAEIDDSTVYRTLSSAEELGLVVRFDQSGKETEFEWLAKRHHHLICRVCNGVQTFDEDVLTALAASLLQATGFSIDLRHLAVAGVCAGCQPAADATEA